MFKKYLHVERWGTDEVEDIEAGKCFIFPKLDGTNASVWLENDELRTGSRNRVLSEISDNAGFHRWALQQNNLVQFLKAYPDLRLFGEWLVPHSLKTYRDEAWRNLYIFDVEGPDGLLHYEKYIELLAPFDLTVIHPVRILNNPTVDTLTKLLEQNTYLIKDGEGAGEGVVLKRYDYFNRYGHQVWAKLIRNEFKELNRSTFGPLDTDMESVETRILTQFLTPAMIHKTLEKIRVDEGVVERQKIIPRLFNTVYHDFIKEELWDILKEYKNPTIDFKQLYRFIVTRIKQDVPELF